MIQLEPAAGGHTTTIHVLTYSWSDNQKQARQFGNNHLNSQGTQERLDVFLHWLKQKDIAYNTSKIKPLPHPPPEMELKPGTIGALHLMLFNKDLPHNGQTTAAAAATSSTYSHVVTASSSSMDEDEGDVVVPSSDNPIDIADDVVSSSSSSSSSDNHIDIPDDTSDAYPVTRPDLHEFIMQIQMFLFKVHLYIPPPPPSDPNRSTTVHIELWYADLTNHVLGRATVTVYATTTIVVPNEFSALHDTVGWFIERLNQPYIFPLVVSFHPVPVDTYQWLMGGHSVTRKYFSTDPTAQAAAQIRLRPAPLTAHVRTEVETELTCVLHILFHILYVFSKRGHLVIQYGDRTLNLKEISHLSPDVFVDALLHTPSDIASDMSLEIKPHQGHPIRLEETNLVKLLHYIQLQVICITVRGPIPYQPAPRSTKQRKTEPTKYKFTVQISARPHYNDGDRV